MCFHSAAQSTVCLILTDPEAADAEEDELERCRCATQLCNSHLAEGSSMFVPIQNSLQYHLKRPAFTLPELLSVTRASSSGIATCSPVHF